MHPPYLTMNKTSKTSVKELPNLHGTEIGRVTQTFFFLSTPARRILSLIVATSILLLLLTVAHYQIWLRSFKGSDVGIEPGKWVWVECQVQPFHGKIEDIGTTGITLSSDVGIPGLPCGAVGITKLGNGRYFLPFQTVLSVKATGRVHWRNPFPI